MKPSKFFGPLVLVALLVSMFASVLITGNDIPDPVATHFDMTGKADGWMSKGSFLYSTLGLATATSGLLIAVFWGLRFLPRSVINLPHRDYWLSTDQRPFTFSYLFQWGVDLAAATTAWQAYLYFAVLQANRTNPRHLSPTIWIATVIFLGLVLFQIIRLFRRFSKIKP